jgi:hypothetical protein
MMRCKHANTLRQPTLQLGSLGSGLQRREANSLAACFVVACNFATAMVINTVCIVGLELNNGLTCTSATHHRKTQKQKKYKKNSYRPILIRDWIAVEGIC